MKPLLPFLSTVTLTQAMAAGPAFDCSKVENGSIEAQICQSEALSAMDRNMAEVYKAAQQKAGNEHPPVLKAEQRGWIKGRNDCWKSEDQPTCIADSYRLRIAELQARYRLVEARGPLSLACDGNPAKELLITYFATQPSSASVEFGDQTSLMFQQAAASGTRYQGRNEGFSEHQGEFSVVWGYEAAPMRCTLR